MVEKIYVVSCNQGLASMGMNRLRTAVDGLQEVEIAMDWNNAKFVPITASEKTQFQEGKSAVVSIEPIDVPAYAVVLSSFYGSNGMGFVSCVGALEFKTHHESRIADKAMFHSHLKAPVLPGDLLGQVIVVPRKK